MKTLHLTLKKKWFDLIQSGEKNRRIQRTKTLLGKATKRQIF